MALFRQLSYDIINSLLAVISEALILEVFLRTPSLPVIGKEQDLN